MKRKMDRKYDALALGELLIDFTENSTSPQGNPLFEANPGGAPCNVLAMLQKFGRRTAFIGKVGRDFFGDQLRSAIEEAGIDSTYLAKDEHIHTTMALVHTKPDGDRDFSFYRDPGADMMLSCDDVPEQVFTEAGIFHFGSLSMTHDKVRMATMKALQIAKDAGCLISFDPNLREPLWGNLEEAKEQTLTGMAFCDILKISDNEIQWLTDETDYTDGVRWIEARYPKIKLICVSLGKEGSRAYYGSTVIEEPAFLRSGTIETTGAGDTFMGCILHSVLEKGLDNLTERDLHEMLVLGNAAAALITERKGALRVMPDRNDVYALCRDRLI